MSRRIPYPGSVDDAHELIQFFRREAPAQLHALRKVVISKERTVVEDVNGDGIEFPGLTYGSPTLDRLMQELGVVVNTQTLHNPHATPTGIKEFRLTSRWTWGHDRVM